ncbi:MAG: hypothetical protein GY801_20130 [bacterium]|nr:hypothetical protein [bacterium]
MKGEYAIRTEGNVLVRKTLFDSIGIFNPEFPLGSHIDWFARVQSLPMAIVHEVVLFKRIHDSNYSLFQIKPDGKSIFRILKQSLERKRMQKVEKTG